MPGYIFKIKSLLLVMLLLYFYVWICSVSIFTAFRYQIISKISTFFWEIYIFCFTLGRVLSAQQDAHLDKQNPQYLTQLNVLMNICLFVYLKVKLFQIQHLHSRVIWPTLSSLLFTAVCTTAISKITIFYKCEDLNKLHQSLPSFKLKPCKTSRFHIVSTQNNKSFLGTRKRFTKKFMDFICKFSLQCNRQTLGSHPYSYQFLKPSMVWLGQCLNERPPRNTYCVYVVEEVVLVFSQ